MKYIRKKSRVRLTRDAERLIVLANGRADSQSLTEDQYWDCELSALVDKLLGSASNNAIDAALDQLFQSNESGFDVLIDQVESNAESVTLTVDNKRWTVLLLAASAVGWSRYLIPSGPIAEASLGALATHLSAHILAKDARLALSPFLYSLDHMPEEFSDIRKLTTTLGQAAISGKPAALNLSRMAEAAPLQADSRFILFAAVVEVGKPLFRWQEDHMNTTRTHCLEQWIAQGRAHLAKLLPGVSFECGLPNAFFHMSRESDRRVRRYTISAALAFLEDVLKLPPNDLRAIISRVGDTMVEEYRIGFAKRNSNEILYGVLWPLYPKDGLEDVEDADGPPAQLELLQQVMREHKLEDITLLPGIYPPDFCDDCAAPLFADLNGEMTHPELPEETEPPTVPMFH